jgi:hypothetical protein
MAQRMGWLAVRIAPVVLLVLTVILVACQQSGGGSGSPGY